MRFPVKQVTQMCVDSIAFCRRCRFTSNHIPRKHTLENHIQIWVVQPRVLYTYFRAFAFVLTLLHFAVANFAKAHYFTEPLIKTQ